MAAAKKSVKKKAKKRGRKPKQISKVQVDKWIKLQATQEEIAGALGIDRHTLTARIREWTGDPNANFSTYYGEKRKAGRIQLREYQKKLAQTSPAMAIFLGKQYLGQKDVVTIEDTRDESLKEKSLEELRQMRADILEIKKATVSDDK